MKKFMSAFILMVLVLTVTAAGCLSSDDGNGSANVTNNTSNNTTNNPANSSNTIDLDNSSAYLIKQMKIANDSKSVAFAFDENSTDRWELIMEPQGILVLTEDEHLSPENAENEYVGLHYWNFTAGSTGKTILDFNYVVGENGKSINHIIYIMEVDSSGNIHVISTLYERLN
ncbi:hypothetical protein MmiHf6_02820 [Methanimicrococcus hongohii]|uniref:Lipoprotein n=1 Tax=Methanimicrococcus hongohii TaxID=3028295 RepID=A0AA96ZTA9_9EURY|nr:protease inhibitor I42 family protein [Methanimicrococcus sp. Hf6]WNY22986.1 hypothetical protein MmiHf6_02820 [Methanimicrococcus sp. Hf6]